jgi:hypothetical protein
MGQEHLFTRDCEIVDEVVEVLMMKKLETLAAMKKMTEVMMKLAALKTKIMVERTKIMEERTKTMVLRRRKRW